MRHPAEILLKALLTGRVLSFDEFQFRIEDSELLWRCKTSEKIDLATGEREEVWFSCDMTVTQFIKHANDMGESDVVAISAGTVLRELTPCRRGN